MTVTVPVAAAVFARAGDIVSIFFVDDSAGRRGSGFSALRGILASGSGRAANSPLVFNETAGGWFMTDAHTIRPTVRAPGQALAYSAAPDPRLPVTRVLRGRVVGTAQVQDMTFNYLDTLVTVEVFTDRPIAPGENWLAPGIG